MSTDLQESSLPIDRFEPGLEGVEKEELRALLDDLHDACSALLITPDADCAWDLESIAYKTSALLFLVRDDLMGRHRLELGELIQALQRVSRLMRETRKKHSANLSPDACASLENYACSNDRRAEIWTAGLFSDERMRETLSGFLRRRGAELGMFDEEAQEAA